jgi:HPt (histidine-containing phosphotransfer) domain-containing protein
MLLTVRTRETVPDTRGLAGCYLQFCAAHIEELGDYIERHDRRAVERIAHALWDNAKCAGLSEISSLGHQLEEYCAGGDWGAICDTFEVIAVTIEALCASEVEHIEVEFGEPCKPVPFEVKKAD